MIFRYKGQNVGVHCTYTRYIVEPLNDEIFLLRKFKIWIIYHENFPIYGITLLSRTSLNSAPHVRMYPDNSASVKWQMLAAILCSTLGSFGRDLY